MNKWPDNIAVIFVSFAIAAVLIYGIFQLAETSKPIFPKCNSDMTIVVPWHEDAKSLTRHRLRDAYCVKTNTILVDGKPL